MIMSNFSKSLMPDGKPFDFSKNPELKRPEGMVEDARLGPFNSQKLLDQALMAKKLQPQRKVTVSKVTRPFWRAP
jgi:hypothetical protein